MRGMDKNSSQEMSLKKTGRKIERNANLILYFNASLFIYRVTESQFEHNLLWFSNLLSTKKKVDTETALQIKIE